MTNNELMNNEMFNFTRNSSQLSNEDLLMIREYLECVLNNKDNIEELKQFELNYKRYKLSNMLYESEGKKMLMQTYASLLAISLGSITIDKLFGDYITCFKPNGLTFAGIGILAVSFIFPICIMYSNKHNKKLFNYKLEKLSNYESIFSDSQYYDLIMSEYKEQLDYINRQLKDNEVTEESKLSGFIRTYHN